MSSELKANILIVDDNVNQCKTMSMILRRKNYAVDIATDGLQAIEKVKSHAFDIIFMDIKMPNLDGVETFRRIKMIQPGIPVMLMTAYAVEDLIQQALGEGVHSIAYKPLNMDTIIAEIENTLKTKCLRA